MIAAVFAVGEGVLVAVGEGVLVAVGDTVVPPVGVGVAVAVPPVGVDVAVALAVVAVGVGVSVALTTAIVVAVAVVCAMGRPGVPFAKATESRQQESRRPAMTIKITPKLRTPPWPPNTRAISLQSCLIITTSNCPLIIYPQLPKRLVPVIKTCFLQVASS